MTVADTYVSEIADGGVGTRHVLFRPAPWNASLGPAWKGKAARGEGDSK